MYQVLPLVLPALTKKTMQESSTQAGAHHKEIELRTVNVYCVHPRSIHR